MEEDTLPMEDWDFKERQVTAFTRNVTSRIPHISSTLNYFIFR